MNEPFVAGTFNAVPFRVHVYPRGVFMIVDETNRGCWTDPHNRVLLPSLAVVDRVLKAHGYRREDMRVFATVTPAPALDAEDSPPLTESASEAPAQAPDAEDSLPPTESAPKPPEPTTTTRQVKRTKRTRK